MLSNVIVIRRGTELRIKKINRKSKQTKFLKSIWGAIITEVVFHYKKY